MADKGSWKNAYEIVWKPLMIGKFGKYYKDVAAIWIWNKFIQRGKSRDASSKERLGYYKGGFYQLLLDVLNEIESNGSEVVLNSDITKIHRNLDDTLTIEFNGTKETFDKVIYTGHTPEFSLCKESDFMNMPVS